MTTSHGSWRMRDETSSPGTIRRLSAWGLSHGPAIRSARSKDTCWVRAASSTRSYETGQPRRSGPRRDLVAMPRRCMSKGPARLAGRLVRAELDGTAVDQLETGAVRRLLTQPTGQLVSPPAHVPLVGTVDDATITRCRRDSGRGCRCDGRRGDGLGRGRREGRVRRGVGGRLNSSHNGNSDEDGHDRGARERNPLPEPIGHSQTVPGRRSAYT